MKKIFKTLLIIIIAIAVVVFGINFIVVGTTIGNIQEKITTENNISISKEITEELKEQKADCILVLGAAVKPDGTPTAMLEDRLETGVYLYKQGIAKKLLLSGDNGQIEYNEVKCMRNYALEHGVKKEDIFLDHAGFSTYESMYRARDIFDVKNLVVVTQSYHEYRALYIGEKLGLTVTGVSADQKKYSGQSLREIREIAARDKDFVKCIIKPEPTYLGAEIPISGNGQKSW